MNEDSTYTGILEYKGTNFTFIFDKKILKLIPPEDKKKEVESWFGKEIKKGTYISGDPVYIKDIIYGISNETRQKIGTTYVKCLTDVQYAKNALKEYDRIYINTQNAKKKVVKK